MSAEIASPIAGGAIPAQNSPLIFPPALRGGIDHWDPLITDGLAESREVILYNGRGVALSSGKPRNRIEDMADDAAAVIRALRLSKVDVLGFEVPPLSWTPKHLCFRSPRCRRNASHTRLSSGGRQSTAQAFGARISVAGGVRAPARDHGAEAFNIFARPTRSCRRACPYPIPSFAGLAADPQFTLSFKFKDAAKGFNQKSHVVL